MSYLEIHVPQKFTDPDGLITMPDFATGLRVDFNANDLSDASGQPIGSWTGTGEKSVTVTGGNDTATHPTLLTTAHGWKALKFNGSQWLSGGRGAGIIPEGEESTIVAVARYDGAGATGRIVSQIGGGGGYRYAAYTTGRPAAVGKLATGSIQNLTMDDNAPEGVWGVLIFRFGAAQSKVDVSWGGSITGTVPLGELDGLVVGANSVNADGLNGQITRLMVYGRVLNDVDTSALMSYLRLEYGI